MTILQKPIASWTNRRSIQLVIAALAMVMISSLQYAWTLFSSPLSEQLEVSIVTIQYAFTLFVMFQTFTQPFSGYFLDKFGYRRLYIIGAILAGGGWIMMGQAISIAGLYLFYALAGVGAAIIYGGSVSIAVRWYPDRRGFASGIVVGAFGMGSIPFIPLIDQLIETYGVSAAFTVIGLMQMALIAISAMILRLPNRKDVIVPSKKVQIPKNSLNPMAILRTPHFWLMWTMFFSVNVGGLIITANAKLFGTNLGIVPSVIVVALMVNSLANGFGRVFWGWVSDSLGRTKTMFVSFGLNAIALYLLPIVGRMGGIAYVVALMMVMFTWGQLFSLFPSLNTDLFGEQYATANNGLLTSAKGVAGIFGGGFGAYLANTYGWTTVFSVAAGFSLYAAIMALVIPRMKRPS
jgi:MFS transporter, OFA family, oxalate/formate antiporter